MLLYGPPGTGKTSLTKAYAKEYDIPICVVESHKLVSSLLGETIKKLSQVVKDAADIAEKNGKFILFFDEIDAVGSERSNVHEVGEIKRAVISFLQTIDEVTNKSIPLAIFGATNHQQQLDSAIWRRFTFHLEFFFPDFKLRKEIIESFIKRIESAGIEISPIIYEELDEEYKDLDKNFNENTKRSILDVEKDLIDLIKQDGEEKGLLTITHGYSGSDIERGVRVALFKAIGSYNNINLTYNILFKSLKLVGGTATHVDQQGVLSNSIQIEEVSKKMPNNFEISNYDDLLNMIPKLIPLMKSIYDILKNKKDLKTKYNTGSRELIDFIDKFIEISKLIKN
jgi:SpoVK/Ycf46/Vps4 family AAA+-type ATPase